MPESKAVSKNPPELADVLCLSVSSTGDSVKSPGYLVLALDETFISKIAASLAGVQILADAVTLPAVKQYASTQLAYFRDLPVSSSSVVLAGIYLDLDWLQAGMRALVIDAARDESDESDDGDVDPGERQPWSEEDSDSLSSFRVSSTWMEINADSAAITSWDKYGNDELISRFQFSAVPGLLQRLESKVQEIQATWASKLSDQALRHDIQLEGVHQLGRFISDNLRPRGG